MYRALSFGLGCAVCIIEIVVLLLTNYYYYYIFYPRYLGSLRILKKLSGEKNAFWDG